MMSQVWPLVGLEAGNPLGFLAALGTLRSLDAAWPKRRVRMSWRSTGSWRPALHFEEPVGQPDIVRALDTRLRTMTDHEAWSLGPDLAVPAEQFRDYAVRAAGAAHATGDRTWADFASAFGCEATTNDDGKIQDTSLRTMSGAGHQHFVQFMAIIVARTEAEHIEKTLFRPWLYDDAVEKQTLRWDPADDVRRALRWRDPSGDPQRRSRGGMLGANRLAIEALPILPTIPARGTLRTTGFSGRGSGSTYWTWPIWGEPLCVDVVRSLLADRRIADLSSPGSFAELQELGVVEIFRSRRLTVDKFRCFTPGQPVTSL